MGIFPRRQEGPRGDFSFPLRASSLSRPDHQMAVNVKRWTFPDLEARPWDQWFESCLPSRESLNQPRNLMSGLRLGMPGVESGARNQSLKRATKQAFPSLATRIGLELDSRSHRDSSTCNLLDRRYRPYFLFYGNSPWGRCRSMFRSYYTYRSLSAQSWTGSLTTIKPVAGL